jgi:hypothetical protein
MLFASVLLHELGLSVVRLLTTHQIKEVPRVEWAIMNADQIMLPLEQLKRIDPDTKLWAGPLEDGPRWSQPAARHPGSRCHRYVEQGRSHYFPAYTPGIRNLAGPVRNRIPRPVALRCGEAKSAQLPKR